MNKIKTITYLSPLTFVMLYICYLCLDLFHLNIQYTHEMSYVIMSMCVITTIVLFGVIIYFHYMLHDKYMSVVKK